MNNNEITPETPLGNEDRILAQVAVSGEKKVIKEKSQKVPSEKALYIPSPCEEKKDKQSEKIQKAFKLAASWLPGAKEQLEILINDPSNPKCKPAKEAMRKYFHWVKEEEEKKVASAWLKMPEVNILPVINKLFDYISQPHYDTCYDKDYKYKDPLDKKDNDYVSQLANVVGNYGRKINHFGYNPRFFEKKEEDQAKTILHEILHAWEAWDDKWPDNIQAASENPDSYAHLIKDLGKY